MQERFAALQETVSEQEIAMVEMGRQLSLYVHTAHTPHTTHPLTPSHPHRSQQKVSDMKEVSGMSREAVWQDDKIINECQECKKQFTVSRRKV